MVSAGSTLRPQSSLWTPASAQLVICQSSCLSADLNPPASATHPSVCLSLSTSCPCVPGVCHSAHQTHGPPPNPGLLFFQQSSDSKGEVGVWGAERGLCGYHSLSWLLLNITACLSRAQTVPWLPAPSSFPRGPSLAGSKGFYLRNQVRAIYLFLPKMSKQSPRKSLDTSVKMCVQECSWQNCL